MNKAVSYYLPGHLLEQFTPQGDYLTTAKEQYNDRVCSPSSFLGSSLISCPHTEHRTAGGEASEGSRGGMGGGTGMGRGTEGEMGEGTGMGRGMEGEMGEGMTGETGASLTKDDRIGEL